MNLNKIINELKINSEYVFYNDINEYVCIKKPLYLNDELDSIHKIIKESNLKLQYEILFNEKTKNDKYYDKYDDKYYDKYDDKYNNKSNDDNKNNNKIIIMKIIIIMIIIRIIIKFI